MNNLVLDANGKIIGQNRGAKAYRRWVPKEWRPEYEAIVALSCTGLNNKEVGRRFGYTKEHVSNILTTPQAKKLREIINVRLREKNLETFGERYGVLNAKALERVESVMNSDDMFEKSPLAIFDRAVVVLKATGAVKGEGGAGLSVNLPENSRTMIVTQTMAEGIRDSLKKADEVKELHSGNNESQP